MLTENEKLTLVVAAGSLLISLVSTGIALVQLRAGVRQSRHQATFEHLGRVRKLLRQISEIDPKEARAAALAYLTHQTDELPEAAKAYLDLLDEWDLLGVAYREKQVDRKIVLKSLRHTFRNPHNVSREFIDQAKKTFENPGVYQDLDYLIQCCVRPTWLEWFSAKGKGTHVGSKARNAAPTTSTAASTVAGADTRRGDSGVPPAAATPPDAQTELASSDVNIPALEENSMSDSTPVQNPTPPPPPPSREERGETPAFRPPPPPPAQKSGSEGDSGS